MDSKYVFLMPQLKMGGGNRVCIDLINQLIRKGELVEVWAPYNSEDQLSCKCDERVVFRLFGKLHASILGKFWNLLIALLQVFFLSSRTTLVYTDPIVAMLVFWIPHKRKVRFIQANDYTLFDNHPKMPFLICYVYKMLTSLSIRFSKTVLFNSRYTYLKICQISGRQFTEKIVTPPIDHGKFKLINLQRRLVIGIIARPHAIKGLQQFLDAWKLVSGDTRNMVAKVILISHDDLSAFEIPSSFVIVKPSSDDELIQIFNEFEIFISSSLEEGFGLPGLEAMACGACLLTSNSGGTKEYAVDGFNALLFEPYNIDLFAKRLTLIICDLGLRLKLKQNAFNTVKGFSPERTLEQFYECIK